MPPLSISNWEIQKPSNDCANYRSQEICIFWIFASWFASFIAAKPHCGHEMLTWISKKSSGLIEYIYNCAKRSLRPWDSQNWVFRVSVRSSVRPSGFFWFFIEKNIGGNQMPPSSEVLKSRFQNFFAKSGRSVAIKAKWKILWPVFGPLFWTFLKKVETSHFSSQPLRARAVRGVSS